jgi:hypothetical protein
MEVLYFADGDLVPYDAVIVSVVEDDTAGRSNLEAKGRDGSMFHPERVPFDRNGTNDNFHHRWTVR